jgi:hypothetical protein
LQDLRVEKFIDIESWIEVTKGRKEGAQSLFKGYRIPVLQDKRAMEIDGGKGCKTM